MQPSSFKSNMKITAVVVTYNRLSLLKECIAAVQDQTVKPDRIIVVNNNSTDGTGEWLHTQNVSVITQENRGGSWGYYSGVKKAAETNADWIWIMDDDTVPYPDALQKMKEVINSGIDNIGFLSSKAVWTDGSAHKMNLQDIKTFVSGKAFNEYDNKGMMLVNSASFVSLLVSKEAVKKAGLPIKEFFIWADDAEFTGRISRAGFTCGYVPESIVLHKTATHYSADFFTDDVKNLCRYRYGMRNSLFMIRMQKGYFKLFMQVLKRIFVYPFRILKKRKDHQWAFIKMVWAASLEALVFNPKIEYLP